MTDNLVKRLRNDGTSWAQDLFNEAADEIERLLSQQMRVYDIGNQDGKRLMIWKLREILEDLEQDVLEKKCHS